MKFEQKVLQYIKKFHMFQDGAGLVIGLSGGADSVALLEILCSLRGDMELRLAAVHVHHGIRTEAQKDVEFCEKLCFEKKVDFYAEYANIPELARLEGLSLEEAGRKFRYDVFEKYRKKLGMDAIAVAHHQNDQAETMLFQLFRGSGLKGLSGMWPQKGRIIRPLLTVTRQEIENYLIEKNLPYVTDSTNESDAYSRNKLRHHVLPVAEEVCPGAVIRMSQTAAQLKEVVDYMEIQATEFLQKFGSQKEGSLVVNREALLTVHPALQKMIVLEAMERVFQSRKNITEKHISGILELLSKEGEKRIHLPNGGQVLKSYASVAFEYVKAADADVKIERQIIVPNATYFLENDIILETKLIYGNNLENIPKNDCVKWFDYDKIKSTLFLRTREQGDYLTVRDDGARKSLQDYFVNEKVPKSERDSVLILAEGQHVLWVIGRRISAHYKVTEQTENILQIHIGGKGNG